jgi:putative ATPase
MAEPGALRHLAAMADGDARKALTALELAVVTTPPDADGIIQLTVDVAVESVQKKAVVYDGDGDAHYDTASAFIKSIRGSDPDAAVYWLAKMIHAGEDPRFIARRLVIAASEDIGLADSQALVVAMAAQQALDFVGMPEGRIALAHATVYLATAPKSNRSYAALGAALQDVESGRTLAVPSYLKDSHVPGKTPGYRYSHDYPGGYVPQAYLPEGRRFYEPTENGQEKRIKERLEYWRAQFEAHQAGPRGGAER